MKRLLAFPLLALLLTGCASAPFVRAVREVAPDFATELRTYATADTAIDTSTKANRIAAADALDAAVKADVVTLDAVRSAWPPVREPYASYIDGDTDLDPNERGLRAGNVARFDRLLEVEGARWIYGGTR